MRTAFSLGAHAADKKAAQREPRSAPAKSAAKRLPARRNLPSELEQRRASHQQASTRGKADSKSALTPATELIFRLDRRGVGWGEEILPHLTVEQRVLKRNRSAQPDPWAVRTPLATAYFACKYQALFLIVLSSRAFDG